MKAADYTPEQRNNAMLYGVCVICLTPRQLHRAEETHPNGETTYWQGIVRPCGHTEADIDAVLVDPDFPHED